MRHPAARLILATWCVLTAGLALGQGGPVLSGTIDDPARRALPLGAYAMYASGDDLARVAEGALRADGTFTLELPRDLPAEYLRAIDAATFCTTGTGDVRVVPDGVPHAMIMLLLWIGPEEVLGAILASSAETYGRVALGSEHVVPGDALVLHFYAQEPVTMEGSCVDDEGAVVHLDIDAPRGWSLVQYTYGAPALGTNTLSTVAAIPAGASWQTIRE